MFLLYSSNPWAEKLHGEESESYQARFIKHAGKQNSVYLVWFFFWFWWEKNFYLWPWLWNWPLIQMDEETHSCSLQSANMLRLQCVIKHSVCIEHSQWVNSSMALWRYTMATREPPGLQVFFKSCKEFNFNGRQLSTKLSVGSSSLESHYRHQNTALPLTCKVIWGKL